MRTIAASRRFESPMQRGIDMSPMAVRKRLEEMASVSEACAKLAALASK